MRKTILIALLLFSGISSASAEPDSQPARRMDEPQLTQPVIDAHILASREINKLRLRAIAGQPNVPPPGPGPAGNIPVITTP
jgi:hypothetical protein